MDLHEEFEGFASASARESGSRLRGADVRARLDARVARGRRVHNAKVGLGAVAAVGAFAVGAVMAPRLDWGVSSPGAAPSPTGTPTAVATNSVAPSTSASPDPTAAAVDPRDMPVVTEGDYLVQRGRSWSVDSALTCAVLADAQPPADAVFTLDAPQWPIPSWLETGRLYGWGDDVLVGGYPTPVVLSSQAESGSIRAAMTTLVAGEVDLSLRGADGQVWGYSVMWSDREDLPHDAPGLFVELNADWGCNSTIPAAGVYDARLSYVREDGAFMVAELSQITVVRGVPSLPDVNAQG